MIARTLRLWVPAPDTCLHTLRLYMYLHFYLYFYICFYFYFYFYFCFYLYFYLFFDLWAYSQSAGGERCTAARCQL